jgi:ABC-2 type transport system ATP-binding protein
VAAVERHGDAVTLACTDADAALHRLLREYPQTCDIEVRGAGLEEAFMQLTSDSPAADGRGG